MKQDYPSKLYYSISEVAKIADVKAHVLRYWETEFPTLKPRKTRTGSRRYRQADIDEILAIKELLYVEGFKIAGARKMRRQMLKEARQAAVEQAPQMAISFDGLSDSDRLGFVKQELESVLSMIRELGAAQAASTVQKAPAKAKELKGKA